MKWLKTIVFCFFSWLGLLAQDTTSFFNFDNSVFVELGSNFIQINNNAGLNIDFSVNWLIKQKMYLGLAYTQIASFEERTILVPNNEDIPELTENDIAFNQQSLGLRFGYIFFEDHKLISFSPDLTVGWANFKFPSLDNEQQKLYPTQHYAAITPALKVVFNVSDYFRIGAAVQYRGFIGLDESYVNGGDLSGIGGGIFLRIGKF